MFANLKKINKIHKGILLPGALASLLTFSALAQQAPPPAVDATGDLPPAASSDSAPAFIAIALALRDGRFNDAEKTLRGMDWGRLNGQDQGRWRRLAAQTALRTGNREWLLEVTKDPAFRGSSDEVLTVSAMRLMQEGQFDSARTILDSFKTPQKLSEIPRRRYLALHARLAEMDKSPKEERVYIAKMVDMLGHWGQSNCQACHANPKKSGAQITTFDAANWWAGKRFSALLTPAEALRVQADAEKKIAADPNDNGQRLRRAYALRAQGKTTESEQALREISWAEFADREKRTPLRLAVFP